MASVTKWFGWCSVDMGEKGHASARVGIVVDELEEVNVLACLEKMKELGLDVYAKAPYQRRTIDMIYYS